MRPKEKEVDPLKFFDKDGFGISFAITDSMVSRAVEFSNMMRILEQHSADMFVLDYSKKTVGFLEIKRDHAVGDFETCV